MRVLLWIMAVTVTLSVVVAAPAQRIATIGKEVPDVKVKWKRTDKKDEEEYYFFRELRGSIALFYFWRSANLESVERLSQMTKLHGEYGDKGVRFISVTADNEEKLEEVMQEKDLSFFSFRFWQGAVIYYYLGALSDPYVVIVDPHGILAWRGLPSDRLEERLEDLHARTDPPAGNQQWLERRFRQAERFHDQGEHGKAYTIAKNLYRMTNESQSTHGRCEALIQACETAAHEWLREAIRLRGEKKYEEAARIVAEIAVRFEDPDEDQDDQRGSGSGRGDEDDASAKRRAEYEIGRMSGDRELKKLIREARENAEAELLNDRAAGLEEDEYYLRAKHIYEQVLEEYEDTAAAKEAKTRLRRIERDKSIQQKIAERRARDQAARWLDIGDHFAAFEFYEEAREQYQRLIEEHPDTKAAQRARQRLSELPKPKPAEKATATNKP